jgi:hypothetical protein
MRLATRTGSTDLQRLADKVWRLGLFVGRTLAAPPVCRRVLERIRGGLVEPALCDKGLEALNSFDPKLSPMASRTVQYRSDPSVDPKVDGCHGAWYRTSVRQRHWPDNDLTYRLIDAFFALEAAGCTTSVAVIQRLLPATEGITRADIRSRIRRFQQIGPAVLKELPYRNNYVVRLNRNGAGFAPRGAEAIANAENPAERLDFSWDPTDIPNVKHTSQTGVRVRSAPTRR